MGLTLILDFDSERFSLTGFYEDGEGEVVSVGESGPFKHLRQGVKFYMEEGASVIVYHMKDGALTLCGQAAILLQAPEAPKA